MLATIREDSSVKAAAERMADLGIDTLIAVDDAGEPRGFVTDRDLVVRCIARDLSVDATEVRAIMTSPVPLDLRLPILERADPSNGSAASVHVFRSATYETLPSLLAIDDALSMVRLEMARQSGSEAPAGYADSDAARPTGRFGRRRPTAPPPS
jgi:CBS domain-containing protein